MKWFLFTYMSKAWDENFPSMKRLRECADDIEEAYNAFSKEIDKNEDFYIVAVSDITGIEFHF